MNGDLEIIRDCPLIMPYKGLEAPARPILYRVIYRTGGPENFQWHVTLGDCNIRKANELKRGILFRERGARVAIIPSGIFVAKGPPNTFDPHNFYSDSSL